MKSSRVGRKLRGESAAREYNRASLRPISATELIDVPRERVFDLLTDLSIRPAFTDHFIGDYRLERLEPVGIGAAARFRLHAGSAWMDTAIVAAERPHLIREHGHGGRSNLVPSFTVWELAEGASPQSCEATVTFWTEPAKLHERLRERRMKRGLKGDWKRALRRLGAIAEDGTAVERVTVGGGDRLPAFAR
jgi:uncharacterized protein YndB with AHSA1/START domain